MLGGAGRDRTRQESEVRDQESVTGGAGRDRTDDLLLAKQALSQLSYGPVSRWVD